MNAAPSLRGVGQEDADLAVLGGSRRAGVLARDAAGLLPLLQKAGLVHDEDAGRLVAEVLDDVVPEVVADAVGVPGGGAQQALHPPGPGLADRLRELPAVLALDPLQQAGQVAPGPFPRFGAGEAAADPRVQLRPSVRAPLDRGQPESTRRPAHLLPSACEREKRTATLAKCRSLLAHGSRPTTHDSVHKHEPGLEGRARAGRGRGGTLSRSLGSGRASRCRGRRSLLVSTSPPAVRIHALIRSSPVHSDRQLPHRWPRRSICVVIRRSNRVCRGEEPAWMRPVGHAG